MKKLLILLLVLAFASTSYGAYSDDFELELSGTTLTIVGLIAPASGSEMMYVVMDQGGPGDGYQFGTPTTIIGSPATAGSLRAIDVINDEDYDAFQFGAGSTGLEEPAWDAATGDWFTVQYSGDVGDFVDVYDDEVEYLGTMEIIPEPITIALLGLGGLFLRRRK